MYRISKGSDWRIFRDFSELFRGTAKFWPSRNLKWQILEIRLVQINYFSPQLIYSTLKKWFLALCGLRKNQSFMVSEIGVFGCPQLYTVKRRQCLTNIIFRLLPPNIHTWFVVYQLEMNGGQIEPMLHRPIAPHVAHMTRQTSEQCLTSVNIKCLFDVWQMLYECKWYP